MHVFENIIYYGFNKYTYYQVQASLSKNNIEQITRNLFLLILKFFADIYEYREYFIQSVARDLRRRYKRSMLGYVWSMLNPLLMMIILAVVFSHIMRMNIKNYAIFLFSGSIIWTYFNYTVLVSIGAIRANATIMSQVRVPNYIFPLSAAFSAIVDMFLSIVPLLLIMLFLGHKVSYHILALPIVLIPLFFFTMGVSLFVAVGNVFYEDTEHLTDVVLKALYFLCPILYMRNMLPDWLVPYTSINPLFCMIEFGHDIFFYARFPNLLTYIYVLIASFITLVFGLYVFNKSEKKFMYFL